MGISMLINKGGRFQPGTTGGGNPKGRPKGRVSAATALIRSACPEILEVVIDQARQGDLHACALILARGVPTLRPALEPVAILSAAQLARLSPSERALAVNNAALAGKVPADVADALLSGIAKGCSIYESSELLTRVEQLELMAQTEERGVRRI